MDAVPTKLRLSAAGLALMDAYEAFELQEYPDQGGRPTIYRGHLILPGEKFNHTRAEGEAIFLKDIAPLEEQLNALSARRKHPLLQRQFDAVLAFTFNIKPSAFLTSTLRRRLLADDDAGAAAEFHKWDKVHDKYTGLVHESEGLKKRREAEENLFLGLPWTPP